VADVEVIGVDRLVNAMKKLQSAATSKEFNRAAAELVLAEARNRVPIGPSRRGHKGGALQRSGRASSTKSYGAVRFGTNAVPYAGPVHFGAVNRPQGGYNLPQPFLYDAQDARFNDVFRRFVNYVEKTANELGL
jgi:hypothetical protein